MGPPRSSKKRPQTNRAHGRVKEILECNDAVKCAVLSALRQGPREINSLRTADATAALRLPDNAASFFRFPPRDQAHDYRGDNQPRDRDSDVKRRKQTALVGRRTGRWGRRRWRSCLLVRDPRLRVVQALVRTVV